MTLKDDVKFGRNEIVEFLENSNIQTRNLFAENMLRHPLFDSLTENEECRSVGELTNTDKIMNDSFWIGLYPDMDNDAINYMIKKIKEYIANIKSSKWL